MYKKKQRPGRSSNLNILQRVSVDAYSNSDHVFSVRSLANLASQS